jgi:hypothetical protein
MRRRIFPTIIVSLVTAICFVSLRTPYLTLAAPASVPQQAIDNPCLVTKPPAQPFVPPPPYWAHHNADQFWYGTESLWTLIGVRGVWNVHNNVLENESRFRTKLTYWRRGFDSRKDRPDMVVDARRLDREAPLVVAETASAVFVTGPAPAAMMTAIDIPTIGCWEIAAKYHDQKLSFVVSVQP